jgi:ketosteroid isomerase-like protein
MSRENVELVRRQFEVLQQDGVEAVVEFWHPDIEWRAVEGAVDDIGVLRGRDAMRRYYEDWVETLDDLRTQVEEVLFEDAERLAVALRVSGRGRASGVPSEGRYWAIYTIRDGQIVSGREYGSREQALEAVGLRK